jgi:PqqD family protein of HPr-rel-A system
MSALKRLALSDEGFVFDPSTGDSYLLNPTALFLLRGLQENREPGALAAKLATEFDADPAQAVCDLDDFLVQLRALRLA